MSVSIIACPKCRTMLLNDTVQCPACRHILDEGRQTEWATQSEQSFNAITGEEAPCPKCGEMVRYGLVRCWNCSNFTRSDIAEAYQQMQTTPHPVIYSTLPGGVQPPEPEVETISEDGFVLRAPTPKPAAKPETPQANEADAGTPPPPPSDDVPHSIATGGDALLEVALSEEAELAGRKSGRKRFSKTRSVSGVLVYCPNGHRIEVGEKHRGKTGRCPKCKSPFFVPAATEQPADGETGSEPEQPVTGFGKYSHWLADVALHIVNPEKLKLKADSLKTDFQLFDVAFANEEVLFVTYTKRKGDAVAKSKSWPQGREKLHDHLRSDGPEAGLPVVDKFTLTAELAKTISVVQPAMSVHESMFAGLPVFGVGRIGIRVPLDPDPKSLRFASLTLTQFRQLAEILHELYGVEEFGANRNIPLDDTTIPAKCHYSDETLNFLDNLEYHEADPEITLKRVGRKCAACGLVISEDSRKKEKIGGANGKGIAKAKCPKCQQKFGNISLFDVETPAPARESSVAAVADAAAATS